MPPRRQPRSPEPNAVPVAPTTAVTTNQPDGHGDLPWAGPADRSTRGGDRPWRQHKPEKVEGNGGRHEERDRRHQARYHERARDQPAPEDPEDHRAHCEERRPRQDEVPTADEGGTAGAGRERGPLTTTASPRARGRRLARPAKDSSHSSRINVRLAVRGRGGWTTTRSSSKPTPPSIDRDLAPVRSSRARAG